MSLSELREEEETTTDPLIEELHCVVDSLIVVADAMKHVVRMINEREQELKEWVDRVS